MFILFCSFLLCFAGRALLPSEFEKGVQSNKILTATLIQQLGFPSIRYLRLELSSFVLYIQCRVVYIIQQEHFVHFCALG